MRVLLPVLLIGALALGACGVETGTDPVLTSPTVAVSASPDASVPPTDDEPASTEPAAEGVATTEAVTPGAASVTILDFDYLPPELTVVAGTGVTWTNEDTVAHTVTLDDDSQDSGSIAGGTSAELTFDTPGTYTYFCAFHPSRMQATVLVTDG